MRESSNMRRNSSKPRSPRTSMKFFSPEPTPYQPVIEWRFCAQAKTQGIARKSARLLAPKRRAGRDPMLSSEISSSGLAAWK